jgi:tyrosyl-tRNA synthetase
MQKSKLWYAYSIPRNNIATRLYFFIDSIRDRLKGKYFPTYFHPNNEIEDILETAGFQKHAEKLEGMWRISLFQR